MIIDNVIFDGIFNNDNIKTIKELNYNELKEFISNLNLDNNSTVIIAKK